MLNCKKLNFILLQSDFVFLFFIACAITSSSLIVIDAGCSLDVFTLFFQRVTIFAVVGASTRWREAPPVQM